LGGSVVTSHSDKERRKALAKEAAERIRKQATADDLTPAFSTAWR